MIALYHSCPDQMDFDAEVVSCQPAAQPGVYQVVLSNTAFYPTGGGQPCDAGTLAGAPVIDVTHAGDDAPILHFVKAEAPLSGTVHGQVDAARRLDHTQQHSGQHLISHVLYEHFGSYSLGLHIGAQDSYVDLTANERLTMTRQIADETEIEIARWIARNEPVKCFFPTPEELSALPLRKKPDAHEMLRIVCIGKDEAVACCGTHVSCTAQVQAVHILSWQQSHGNLRVFFVAGLRALRYAKARMEQADAVARLFSCSINEVTASVERLKEQNAELSRRIAEYEKQQLLEKLRALTPVLLPGGMLTAACLDDASDAQLKDALKALTQEEKAVCFLCAPAQEGYAVALGVGSGSAVNAGKALKEVLSALGGKGGGRADCAFGRCPTMDILKVQAMLSTLMG